MGAVRGAGRRQRRQPGVHRRADQHRLRHADLHRAQHRGRAESRGVPQRLPELHGAQPVNLDRFRTLPSWKATGAKQTGRLTTLQSLNVDTSWYTRYRSTKNPDFGATFPQAITIRKQPAIPISDADTPPHTKAPLPSKTKAETTDTGDRVHGGVSLRVHRERRLEPLHDAVGSGAERRGAADRGQHRRDRESAFRDLAGRRRQRCRRPRSRR